MASIGTLVWSKKTGGRLSGTERLRLTAQGLAFRLRSTPADLLQRFGFGSKPFQLDLDSLRIPDSTIAKDVREHVTAVSPAWLTAHCLRSYLWAAIFGARDGIRYDEELLYAAALLHDLGLVEDVIGTLDDVECFAVEGALTARELDALSSWQSERRDRLAEAITLHLNVTVGLTEGPEAHLLHEATAFDTIGARVPQIHPDTRAAVIARHPRLDQKTELVEAFKRQARTRKRSRAAFLASVGFIGALCRAPFPDSEDLSSKDLST